MNKVSLIFILMIGFCYISKAQTVIIGSQVWMTQNLDVATFRNGEPIPEAKTDEEWKKAGENQQPAWCYYENNQMNGAKYGKLYNWYAVNDPRGLAPVGYHIPTDVEWTKLIDFLGSDAGKKMKSTSGWKSYGCKKCDGGSSEFKKKCTACKGTQNNSSEPFSGNGTNSCGFLGLPVGFRGYDGEFHGIGDSGDWWSSTEFITTSAYSRGLSYYYGHVIRGASVKAAGYTVRCLRD